MKKRELDLYCDIVIQTIQEKIKEIESEFNDKKIILGKKMKQEKLKFLYDELQKKYIVIEQNI